MGPGAINHCTERTLQRLIRLHPTMPIRSLRIFRTIYTVAHPGIREIIVQNCMEGERRGVGMWQKHREELLKPIELSSLFVGELSK